MLRAVPAMIRAAWSRSGEFEILELPLGDFLQLLLRHHADLFRFRVRRALGDLGDLLEQHGGRRALEDELEAAVAIDRDDHGDGRPHQVPRLLVELLDELADVDAVRTERGTDRRRGSRLTPRRLQLDDRRDLLLLCHDLPRRSDSFDLPVFHFNRSSTAKDLDADRDLAKLLVDPVYRPRKTLERSVCHSCRVAHTRRSTPIRRP